jgi:ABC-type multidrug transport system ATPase subunit
VRVELEGVGKHFGRVAALSDVNVTIPAGARVALVGPNGSGKSTLVRALMGLIAHEGTVRFDGASPGPAHARARAYVPQVAPLAAAPVGELVRAVCSVRDVPLARVAQVAARFELVLDSLAGRPFRALSGGMRAKILLALALATRASLFLLDEPTASLDARARTAFYAAYRDLAAGATLILTSHRLDEIQHLVDHVLVLADGRVESFAPVDGFLDARTQAVVELRAHGDVAAAWLAAHGFTRGTADWWVRTVTRGQKPGLVRAAAAELGVSLADLVVRDLDRVEVARA